MSSPVIVDEKAQENGMAVMMADLITQNMEQNPDKIKYFNKLKAVVAITAVDAEVKLTMFFNKGSCMVYDGIVGKTHLHIVADSETLLELIRSLPDSCCSAMLIGHNPSIGWLVNQLADARIENMPTCAVATIELPGERWDETGSSTGRLLDFDYPKKG